MTLQELMNYGSQMMEKHPAQKDLIFIGVDDCLMENEDDDERLEKMHAWIEKICSDGSSPKLPDGNCLVYNEIQEE
jgi:hypothetical protein